MTPLERSLDHKSNNWGPLGGLEGRSDTELLPKSPTAKERGVVNHSLCKGGGHEENKVLHWRKTDWVINS